MDILNETNLVFTEFARREYKVSGTEKKVLVILGKPQVFPTGRDYYCPFKIFGGGIDCIRWTLGIDEIQAIQHALSMINTELSLSSHKQLVKRLRMHGGREGGLGFEEWDLMLLETIKTRLQVDTSLKNDERAKLAKKAEELKLRIKDFFEKRYLKK